MATLLVGVPEAAPLRAEGYRVAVTGDQARPDGTTIFGDIGLARLSAIGIDWEVIDVPDPVMTSAQLRNFDAVLVMGGRAIDPSSLAGTRIRHVARFGAGFDSIDTAACTSAGAVLTNAPDAVRRPMAHSALALVLALAHNLVIKDRLVREGRWSERTNWQGRGLAGATVGVVGLGGIGTETARIFRALGVDVVAYNRAPKTELAQELGIRQLPLHEVASLSDFLVIAVAGNPGTAGLVDRSVIAAMHPDAYLVNLARGVVVDEAALIEALRDGSIRGAALDVFQQEPIEMDNPLLQMENVVLSPHSLCWTDGFAAAVADSAISAIIDVAEGRKPQHPVNPEVLDRLGEPA